MLGADDDRAAADARAVQRGQLLERTGGEHAQRPRARDEARAARAFAAAGREDDRTRPRSVADAGG